MNDVKNILTSCTSQIKKYIFFLIEKVYSNLNKIKVEFCSYNFFKQIILSYHYSK